MCALCITALAACGSARNVSHTRSAATRVAASTGARGAATGYPVHQLPPGHITLAEVGTPQGPVAVTLHRIRYLGHVSLCVSLSTANGGSDQSCANYPLGPKSNQDIGDAPVWWATNYVALCAKPRFQVVSGVLLRRGLTAWLRTPAGFSRLPTTPIPKPFAVAGGLLYANIASSTARFVLRDADGKTVYTASVAPLTGFPTAPCSSATAFGSSQIIRSSSGAITRSFSGGIILTRPGEHVVP